MRDTSCSTKSKRIVLRLVALTLVFALSTAALAEIAPLAFRQDHTSRNGLVRVRLSSLGNLNTITLNLRSAYSVNDGQIHLSGGSKVKVTCNTATGQLTLSVSGESWSMGDYFTLNRGNSDASATIAQASTSNPYPADFAFRSTQKSGGYVLLPVAYIQMEDYLYGVLPYEMGNSAPLEALKAQAIAARTYTIRMMSDRAGNNYDVVDTTADQVYKGTPSGSSNCKKAVDATRGMVLKYGSRYAETYYSSSNGGQTEAARNIWGGSGHDYLRVTDDPYDRASSSAKTKTVTIYRDLDHGNNRSSLMQLLKEKTVSCLKQNGYSATLSNTRLIWLESVKLHTAKYASPSKLYTKADFILTVETGGVKTSVIVTADIFRELEGMLGMSLQSSSNEIWSVTNNASTYTLKAGRYGHGVGMSQYGAMEMARQGFAYDSILGFYYPGCTNVKLNLSDDPTNDSGDGAIPESPSYGEEFPSEGDLLPEATTVPEDNPTLMGYAIVTANDFVNLRQSPSLDAPILSVALEGEKVAVLSYADDWALVEYGGIRAYAMRRLLSEIVMDSTTTQPESTYAPENTVEPTTQPVQNNGTKQAMIFSVDAFASFWETPELSGKVLMQLPHGAYLDVLGSSGEFTHVSYLGIEGYVMTAVLVFGEALGPAVPVVTEQPYYTEEPPVIEEPLVTEQPPVSTTLPPPTTEIPLPTTTEMPPQEEYIPNVPSDNTQEVYQTAIVTTRRGSLNMRELPHDHASVLTRIPQYEQVEALEYSPGWCRVRYYGMEGYAMSAYLTFTDQVYATPEPTPEVTYEPPHTDSYIAGQAVVITPSGSLNLRMEPYSSAKILRTLRPGTVVAVHGVDGQWALVSYHGYTGYVMVNYLDMGIQEPNVPDPYIPVVTTVPDIPYYPDTTPVPVTPEPTCEPEYQPIETPAPEEEIDSPSYDHWQPQLPPDFVEMADMVAVAGAGHASFRVSPSLSERILYVIPAGDRFEVIGCSDTWCMGIWGDTTGYVSLSEVCLYTADSLP